MVSARELAPPQDAVPHSPWCPSIDVPKINTTSKSSIEETGNSPGLIHRGFRTARDVSWLVWYNRKLQVWLNRHWGKDASVGNAICLLAQAPDWLCSLAH